jgi:hypothetical protein
LIPLAAVIYWIQFTNILCDSSVGIAKGYGQDGWGSTAGRGQEIVLFSTASRLAVGSIQPPIQWILGALSLVKKQPGREADYSPPSTAEVKNDGPIPSLPHTSSWGGAQLVKHRNNFTFT